MNIMFVSLNDFDTLEESSIYTDLLKVFIEKGHHIYAVSPREKRKNGKTELLKFDHYSILKVRIGNIQKTNMFEKGVSTLQVESLLNDAIKAYLEEIKIDLVVYATPPITTTRVIKNVKKRFGAKSYLLLKDIFPQNAVDLGLFGKNNPIYWYFRRKEKELYRLSDYIGCMSQANVDYVIKNNPDINKKCVEVCPNSINPVKRKKIQDDNLKQKYSLPMNKKIFVYGGNLGKPQDIDFICQCLTECEDYQKAFFLIVGSGTEYSKLEKYIQENQLVNVKLMSQLPKDDYDALVSVGDVGLIFLDHRFTIPNFPSRLLSYMQTGLPVLATTDPNTDVGQVIEKDGFGHWCESNKPKQFKQYIKLMCEYDDLKKMGENAWKYLNAHYTAEQSYNIIMKHFN